MALKLEITKGPRAGETLEYRPGLTIRVGRVVRGNNLTIKDSGISTKHLSIQSEFGKWLLQDLGSSNGSFLNDELIDPDVPVDLSDGDCIKIGESTSISVKIEVDDGSCLRRNTRRGLQEKAGGANQGRRGKVAKEKEDECGSGVENADAVDVVEKPRRGRKPRVLKSVVEEEKVKEEQDKEEKMGQLRKMRTRQTQSSKNENIAVSCSVLEKIPENSEVEGGQVKVVNKKATRAAGGTRRKKNSPEKLPECAEVIDLMSKRGSSSDSIEKLVESGKESDLENMTLEEWFDYLEIALPKQIIESSEEMIKGMRLKAERVHNYMVEQKNEKAKVLVGKSLHCGCQLSNALQCRRGADMIYSIWGVRVGYICDLAAEGELVALFEILLPILYEY
ncbi:hypothetical protein F8388_003459 [Cannabis sativa]|uniref:FHA domain-containing protein n=1 Tax=Cannabis sativa TaxID=3483 RepID=A0A7J6F7S2_CANSA|nr:hypothetical protein F8388_003459 [Cannabis sativa]KAF4380482.1 hypothetical protein G4B88_011728 [Cannabis sativa]